MTELEQARQKINEIDVKMADLFEERMKCAEMVANYKRERGLPILDSSREQEIIGRNSMYVDAINIRPYYTTFMQSVMDISKKYQHQLIEGSRIAYSGIEGSFAHIASSRLFPDGELVSFRSFKEAYEAVENGDCDLAVLPIENSHAGEVGQVTDLMFEGNLYINSVYPLRVSQNLMAVPGATLDSIKTVISHPQALGQCAEFIEKHGYVTVEASNTARAAKEVADKKDITWGAIASKETAALYGLDVLDHDINEDSQNTTRFAVFSRVRDNMAILKDNHTFVLMFTVKNEAGTLAKAITAMGNYGYSMRVIRSRPLKNQAWQYYFYVEVEGKLGSDEGKAMLNALEAQCETLKVIGTYSNTIEVQE